MILKRRTDSPFILRSEHNEELKNLRNALKESLEGIQILVRYAGPITNTITGATTHIGDGYEKWSALEEKIMILLR